MAFAGCDSCGLNSPSLRGGAALDRKACLPRFLQYSILDMS